MSDKNTTEIIGVKRAEPRYIMINEDIFDALSIHECAVYQALRYESDYSKETSIVKRSVSFIVEKSKVGRRKVFECLSSLETIHYLIQRIEMPVTGIQNNYNVARTLNFFNPLATSAPIEKTSAPHALVVKNCTETAETSAPHALPSAPHALPSAPGALHIINSFSNISNTTTTEPLVQEPKNHSEPVVVSLISSKEKTTDLNNRLLAIYRANPFVTQDIMDEDDFLSAALYSIKTRDEGVHVNGRIKGIRILVETGKFEGESGWIQENIRERNKKKGLATQAAVEKQMKERSAITLGIDKTKKAPEVIAELKALTEKNKAELNKEPSYAVRNHVYRPTMLPEQLRAQAQAESQ